MKKLSIIALSALAFSACVPQRQYQDAITARDACMQDTAVLHSQLRMKTKEVDELSQQLDEVYASINLMRKDSIDIHNRYDAMVKANEQLREIEDVLNNRINQLLALSANENQQLREDLQKKSDELIAKEKELNAKAMTLSDQQKSIDALTADLEARSKRVEELESILNKQEQTVTDLKNTIDKALSGFSASDLTVERKNGKVYVSLSEKLLFASGSTVVDPKGKDALKKLADVLKANPDIRVEIEGHTDNVPLKSNNFPKDNWDLSVLRATSIVKILTQENGVDAKRVIAEGRGEFFPIADNTTTEGKARNRRTEIILSPNLDALYDLINSK
ncbi:MAG TPA: OmpA family protein [Chitinophagales bacterium]|nr:OmpA family protein [Chitinophagales bacterium]HMZ88208.1 OmpA family protein [Chitinophagales bacterium]HNA58018.1 OmpA family protein [Chitinophagales bacterium]HNE44611.1 OmpA family protein [Chitinophagales bacterium]HNF68417.1 OmpA family protein [Chitinophagales bacterium]